MPMRADCHFSSYSYAGTDGRRVQETGRPRAAARGPRTDGLFEGLRVVERKVQIRFQCHQLK
jgi:hypothetical protein